MPSPSENPFANLAIGWWLHQTTARPDVGTTPYEVVHRQDKLELRYYAPSQPLVGAHPIVLVPSLINRSYILDLEPDRSLCRALAAAGHPTFLVDWGTPGPEDADEDVAYVVAELLHRSVQRACRRVGAHRAVVLGYCMGGTLASVYAALYPGHVAGLIALNAPVCFRDAGRFQSFVAPERFDVEDNIGPDGLVPVSAMKPAFQMLDPVGALTKYGAVAGAYERPAQFRRVMARERWLEENVPVAGAFAREFIRETYQGDRLMTGGWVIRGTPVVLKNITAPTLVVACRRDFIAPPASCLPLASAVGASDVTTMTLECGHIGVVVGSEGPRTFYPLIDTWLRERAQVS